MNRADVVAAAVEHAIPTSRLLLFAELVVAGSSRDELATVLSSYRPSEVLTGGAQLVADDAGITGTGLHGDVPVHVSWAELADYLAAVATPALVEDLAAAYRASLDLEPASAERGGARLAELRAGLAYRAVSRAWLIPRSLFAGTLTERVVLEGTVETGGFAGRVSLDPVEDDAVACRVNGQIVAVVRYAPETHRVATLIFAADPSGRQSADDPPAFIGTVRHVPPGESPGPLPATFADRVGVEVFDEDDTGARWVLQVDGFDVVIMEAGNGVAPTVRSAVYDNDPTQPFQRYEGRCTVPPAAPPRPPGPRHAGAAVNRLAELRRPPASGPGR